MSDFCVKRVKGCGLFRTFVIMNFADKIFSIKTEQEFEQVALEVFRFQAEHCAPYKQYIELLGISPCEVKSIEQIPF